MDSSSAVHGISTVLAVVFAVLAEVRVGFALAAAPVYMYVAELSPQRALDALQVEAVPGAGDDLSSLLPGDARELQQEMGLDVIADGGVCRHLPQLCKLLVPADDELLHALVTLPPNRREV